MYQNFVLYRLQYHLKYPKYVGYLKGEFALQEETELTSVHAAIKVLDKDLVRIGYDAAIKAGFTCNVHGLREEWNSEVSFFKDFDNNTLEIYYEY